MKKWQIENSEKSEISEKLFRVFLFPSFRKVGFKNLGKNFPDFWGFWIFDLARILIDRLGKYFSCWFTMWNQYSILSALRFLLHIPQISGV